MKKYWYLAYCHPKEEERAKLHLKNQGIDSYYPLVLTRKILRGKMIEKTEPMFPRYLFIHVDIHEFSPMKIRSTRGISRVIGHGEKWNIVPAELIYQLMRNEDSDELRDVLKDQFRRYYIPLFTMPNHAANASGGANFHG